MRRPLRRFANWLHPDLTVPHISLASAPPVEPADMPLRGLDYLFGHRTGVTLVVVSASGTEFPIGNSQGWSVLDFQATLHEIEELPELTPESRRA